MFPPRKVAETREAGKRRRDIDRTGPSKFRRFAVLPLLGDVDNGQCIRNWGK